MEAFVSIAPPTNCKELRQFIGLVNYYRDMWVHSETFAQLTALTSQNARWHWTDTEQKTFDAMKRIISRKTLLSYPNSTLLFDIHTNASQVQLAAVISQQGRAIAFY